MSARAAAVGDCFCRCHEINDECMFCAEHPEMHRDAQPRECPDPEAHRASVPAAVNVGKQSNSSAPRKEARPQPVVTAIPQSLSDWWCRIGFLATSIVFTLTIFFLGLHFDNPADPMSPEESALERTLLFGALAFYAGVYGTLGAVVVSCIGASLYVAFRVLAPVSSFLLKPLKPILLPVAYPFIGAWVVVRGVAYLLIKLVKLALAVPILVLKSFFGPIFIRRHSDSLEAKHGIKCECVKCVAVMVAAITWIMMMLTSSACALLGAIFWPVHAPLMITSLVFLGTNILSIFYELGRWYSNKRAPQVAQEKPNPIV